MAAKKASRGDDMGALTTAAHVRAALRELATAERARSNARFFKTGPGEYGEGDRFLGVTVPAQRVVAKRARGLALGAVDELLASPWHEERLTGLLVLVERYERGDAPTQDETARFYATRFAAVNNWDLVDLSAWQLLGRSLRAAGGGARAALRALKPLARSPVLWERRIAMVATYAWIKEGEAEPALTIARILLRDREDLMHKAVGWMLREVGKRVSQGALEAFLEAHAAEMPRTALRYALERLPEAERRRWMQR